MKKLTAAMSLRLTPALARRLARLARQLPALTRHAIAREALRLGIEAIERSPTTVLTNHDPWPAIAAGEVAWIDRGAKAKKS